MGCEPEMKNRPSHLVVSNGHRLSHLARRLMTLSSLFAVKGRATVVGEGYR